MLETVREFGLEQLTAHGEEDAGWAAHAAWIVALAEESIPHYDGPGPVAGTGQIDWVDRMERELPNCRAALEWARDRNDAETLVRLTGALWRLWLTRAYPAEARTWLERALVVRDAAPPETVIELLVGAVVFFVLQAGDEKRGGALCTELLARAAALADPYGEYWARSYFGILAQRRGAMAEADAQLRWALELAPAIRNPENHLGLAWEELAFVTLLRGDRAGAAAAYEHGLAHHRTSGNSFGIVNALTGLARVRLAEGNPTAAAGLLAEGLVRCEAIGNVPSIADIVGAIAAVGVSCGRLAEAARLLGALDAWRQSGRLLLFVDDADVERVAVREARDGLDAATFAEAWTAEGTLDLAQLITEVRTLIDAIGTVAPAPSPTPMSHDLTPRELDVLRQVAAGRSDREIAEALFVSRHTASNHVGSILAKLGVRSRAEATAYAVRHRLA